MGALFTSEDRDAISGGLHETYRRLVAFSSSVYFDTPWLNEDGTEILKISKSANIGLWDLVGRKEISETTFSVSQFPIIVVFAKGPSGDAKDQLDIEFVNSAYQRTWAMRATFDSVQMDILADFDRDGTIDEQQPGTEQWGWGASGLGAILLVNSDRDGAYPNPEYRDRLDRRINGPLDLQDMTKATISLKGPPHVNLSDCTIRLHVSDAAASRVRVFDTSRIPAEPVIGPGIPTAVFPAPLGDRELALEGLDYPDAGFSGLISISADLESSGSVLGTTSIVLRVAPWIALPNTQPVERLFIAEMKDGSNAASIRDMRNFATEVGISLEIVPHNTNRGDRWLQDEVEIGFAANSNKTIPVVLDSPRDRGLDDFPETMLLGPDFGYVTRGNDRQASSLDSFGNLDCTPPHSSADGDFPFGRIIFGGAAPGGVQGRRMMKVVRDFVTAQIVQPPIELYSDWLNVGHVDEFLAFVPAPDEIGFRLLLASPRLAMRVLEDAEGQGHGALNLMDGRVTEISISSITADAALQKNNERYQEFIDYNRNILISEMGLQQQQISEIPALYYDAGGRASALFPNMINMQVVNSFLAIPKPFGPIINGGCLFEEVMKFKVHGLGLSCRFIDTFDGYFQLGGEIHCGTNVVRRPFAQPWWTSEPARITRRLGRLIV